jgi:hypothetical protein
MRFAFAAAALVFSGPIALAQTGSEVIARTPKKIYEFIPYCTSHFNDCRYAVFISDRLNGQFVSTIAKYVSPITDSIASMFSLTEYSGRAYGPDGS